MTDLQPDSDEAVVANWLIQQKFLREFYSWEGQVPEAPSAETLRILSTCQARLHNISCYQEGHCCNPSAEGCAFKEK